VLYEEGLGCVRRQRIGSPAVLLYGLSPKLWRSHERQPHSKC
jgi:hypothetical protein